MLVDSMILLWFDYLMRFQTEKIFVKTFFIHRNNILRTVCECLCCIFSEWFRCVLFFFLPSNVCFNSNYHKSKDRKNSWANELNCVVYFSGSAPRLQLRKCLNRFVVFFSAFCFSSLSHLLQWYDCFVQPLWHTVWLSGGTTYTHTIQCTCAIYGCLARHFIQSESICQFLCRKYKGIERPTFRIIQRRRDGF